jgi:ATP-binding cassette subfamily C protein CydD
VARLLAGALGRGLSHSAVMLSVFAALAVLRALLSFLSELLAHDAGAAARRRLRTDALTRLLQAGPALLRQRHSGELVTASVDRVEALDGFFARWLPASMLAVAVPVLIAVVALAVDPVAGGILVAAGLLVPLAMALSGIGAAAASRRQFLALTRLQARFLDRVSGIATIVLSGRAEDEARALARAADELRARTMRVLRVAFLSSAALDCAAAAALVILALRYGVALAGGGLVRVDQALFLLLLVPEFFAPLRAFSAAYQDRMHAVAAAEALVSLPPAALPPAPLPVRTVSAHGVTVSFEDVHLTWDPARGPALDGLSFRVPAGETLVLAGPSGAGKSTVMEILLGFVRPDAGRVTLNGADIATIVPDALSRMTAWIGQRPVLFAGTLRENIRFGRPDATDEEVLAAARAARVDSFADMLPQGLDTMVGEHGYGLSGGQAQRVAIARAFLKNAPLLLLDEPTAHLDPATEAEVLASLRRLSIGRTVILASHASAAHAFAGRRLDIRAGKAVLARGAA